MWHIPLLVILGALAAVAAAQHADAQGADSIAEIIDITPASDRIVIEHTVNIHRVRIFDITPNGETGSQKDSRGNHTSIITLSRQSVVVDGIYVILFAVDNTLAEVRHRDDTFAILYRHPERTWTYNMDPVLDTSNFTGHTVRVGERFEFALQADDPENQTLTFLSGHRNVEIRGSTLQWTPEERDYRSGQPTNITVRASDGLGGVDTADLQVTVMPVVTFDPPDLLAIVRGQPTTLDMEPYITTSPPNVPRQLTEATSPSRVEVAIDGTSVTLTPSPGTTTDSFDLRLDTDDVATTRMINITVIDLPTLTAVLDTATVETEGFVRIPVLDNDIVDPDTAELLITGFDENTLNEFNFGRKSISDDRKSILYSAFSSRDKTEVFNYTVTATGGVTSTADIVVRITNTNDNLRPEARDIVLDLADGNTVDAVIGGYVYDFDEPADQLRISVGNASKGTPGIDGSVITYEMTSGASGIDRFEYNVTDTDNSTDTGTVKVLISPNMPPTADNASRSVASGGSVSIDLSGLTDDPNNDHLEFSITTGPQFGDATITGTTLTYMADRHPGANNDMIVYAATDTEEATARGTISISLTFTVSLRTAPDMDIGVWGKTTYIPVLENDIILPEGTPVTINVTNPGSMGTAAVHNATHISYMPRNGTTGTDIVTYTISAMGSTSDPANITMPIFEVTPNMPPVTKAVTRTAVSGGPAISVDLSEDNRIRDDRDDIANLTVTVPTQPEAGLAELVGDTIIRYTPRAAGTHMVNYTVADSEGLETVGTITVRVSTTATKMDPVAPDFAITTPEDTPLAFPTPAFDPDGGDVRIVHATDGDIGMTENNATFITYMPGLNLNGNDTITYTVTDDESRTATGTINITVTPVNDPPVLDHIRNYRVLINTPINFTAVATDPDGDDLIYFMENDWPRMSLGRTDGLFTWTPFDDKNRNAVFQIWATDDLDNLYSTDHSDYQEVTISVLLPRDGPVNQPPTIDPIDNQTVPEGETLRVRPNATDMDRDLLEYELTGDPLPDEAAFDDTTGHLDWTPGELDGGTSYDVGIEVYDGYVTASQNFTITVEESNQNPVFNSVPARRATVGETLTIPITATDADVPEQMLEFSIFGETHGAMLLNTTSSGTTLSWTPNSTHIPSQTIEILVQDSFSPNGSAHLPISIAVTDVPNTPPEADPFMITVAPSQTVPTDLAAGGHIRDAEQNATTLIVTINEMPSKGNASASGTTITYTANADAVGTDTVSYTVTDDGDLTATATMTVRIEVPDEPMSAPRAESFSANTTEDMEVTVAPVISDPDGGAVDITAVTNGRSGTANHTARTVTYTPNPDFNGDDTITYTVTDDEGDTATGRIDITVTPVNDPPVIGALRNWNINATDLFRLEIMADDVDEDTLIFNLTEGPESATLSQQGFFLWQPTNDDIANHTVTITVSDGQGGTDSETITITVLPAGQATSQPPALDPIGDRTVSEGQPLQIRPRADDPDMDPLTYSLDRGTLPEAAVFNNMTGHLDWTPGERDGGTSHNIAITVSDGRSGLDSESITITVRETNQNPTITPVPQQTAVVGQQLTVRILANDTDIPEQTLSYNITGNDLGANISGNVVTWTPDSTHAGSQTITVLVQDGYDPPGSDSVAIPITVSSAGINRDPVAPDVQSNARLNALNRITPDVTDPDGDDITIIRVTGQMLGTVDQNSLASGTILYRPNQTGIDRLTYTVQDSRGATDSGTINVYINERSNARPALAGIDDTGTTVDTNVNFTANAMDSNGDPLTFEIANVPEGASINGTTGYFSWTPAESQSGTHIVTIIVHDDRGGASWQDVTITVLRAGETNRPPVPEDITTTAVIGEPKTFQPRIEDLDGDTVTMTLGSPASRGTILDAFVSRGILIYIGTGLGQEEFTYALSDGRGGVATGTIRLEVLPPANISPTLGLIGDRNINALQELAFNADATDIDSTILTFDLIGEPAGAQITPQGAFSWTPTEAQEGRHDFTVIVSDDAGGNDTEAITVNVRDKDFVNSPPIAPDIVDSIEEATPGIIRPPISDPNDDPVRITVTTGNTKGEIITGFLRAGIVIYRPDTGQTGIDTVNYTVSDGSTQTSTGTITIFINADGNRNPVLAPIGLRNINAGEQLAFNILARDRDPLSYLLAGAPAGAEISGQGAFSWTPTPADVGNHTFTVAVYDDRGGSISEVITVRVLPAGTANGNPIAPTVTITVNAGSSTPIAPEIGDPDGDQVSITGATGDGSGTIISSPDSILYIAGTTPGSETVTYTVTDIRGASSTGTISITIQ